MAGEKETKRYYGPRGLVERLGESFGESFEGFEFAEYLHIHAEASITSSKCRITIKNLDTSEEFFMVGFCSQLLLTKFFLKETLQQPIKIAGFGLLNEGTATYSVPYEISMEVIIGNPAVS